MNNKRLGELASLVRGVSYNPEDLHEGLNCHSIALIKNNNIKDDGTLSVEKVVYVDKSKVAPDQILKKGDIIVCASGSESLVGKAALFELEGEFTFGAFCKVVRPNIINPKYLGLYFVSPLYRSIISMSAQGAILKNLRNEHLLRLNIRYPDDNEQEYIQLTINKVLHVILRRKKQLQLFDDLIKARFVEMFGDPTTNPKGYPVHHLSKFTHFLTSGSRGWSQYCDEGGSEWFITIKNVKDCYISIDNMQSINAPQNAEAKRTRVQEGDLLISITADLGRTGVVTKEIAEHGAYINQHLICIRLNRENVEPLFVAYYLESPAGKGQFVIKNQNAVKAGLNFNSINTLNLMVPPLNEQQAFIRAVKQIGKSKRVVQQALNKAQLLFDSLMQKYFG